MAESYDKKVTKAIRADVKIISVSEDPQASFDVGGTELPLTLSKTGGRCTSALLDAVKNESLQGKSWVETLQQMKKVMGSTQMPVLSSSRMLDVNESFRVAPPHSVKGGTRRAVLVGINYGGKKGELSACHKSVLGVHGFLTRSADFKDSNIVVLMDDGINNSPTRENILNAYEHIVRQSQAGDSAFCQFVGHSGRIDNPKSGSKDGHHKTLIPVDFDTSGHILDKDIFEQLVCPMPAGVTMTCLMDCCHGGAIVELPYRLMLDKENPGMFPNEECNVSFILGMTIGLGIIGGVMAVTGNNNEGGTTADAPAGATTVEATSDAAPDSGNDAGECCECDLFSGCWEELFGGCCP